MACVAPQTTPNVIISMTVYDNFQMLVLAALYCAFAGAVALVYLVGMHCISCPRLPSGLVTLFWVCASHLSWTHLNYK
jgi:hypothetical protein